jgi:hypothetical protein
MAYINATHKEKEEISARFHELDLELVKMIARAEEVGYLIQLEKENDSEVCPANPGE